MSSHPTLNLLRLVLGGRLSPEELLRREHRHLTEICDPCQVEWESSRDEVEPFPWMEHPAQRREPLAGLPEDERHASYGELDRRLRLQQRRALQRKVARRHLSVLRQAEPGDRPHLVESAISRYRSRAFAELLVLESQRLVRTNPAEAESLASLVPLVVLWIPGSEGQEWARDLALRGRAWAANARRVRGDLQAADRAFRELGKDWEGRPPSTPRLRAELASLEASLRIDQRRAPEAHRLLHFAAHQYEATGDGEGVAKVLLQKAKLSADTGRTLEALDHLQEASRVLPPSASSHLHLAILARHVLALCELERPGDAAVILADSAPDLDLRDSFQSAVVHGLYGRVAMERRDFAAAEAALLSCRDTYLHLDRHYDAALVSLDLAQVYLEAGRVEELEALAADLVPQFRARGVGRETLAALRLLAEAVAARRLTRDLLGRIRERMEARVSPDSGS